MALICLFGRLRFVVGDGVSGGGVAAVVSEMQSVATAVDGADIVKLRSSGRRRRLGLGALGGLFVVVAALLSAAFFSSLRDSVPVVVAGGDLAAGEVLSSDSIVVVEIGTDGLGVVSHLRGDQQDQIVGLTALGPIPAGTLLSPSMFGDRSDVIPEGRSVVGAVLDRGALPAGVLQPGDEVELIAVVESVLVGDGSLVGDVLGRGVVWAVEPAPDLERGTSISVVVDAELVTAFAQAAADGRLRVGLVGQ